MSGALDSIADAGIHGEWPAASIRKESRWLRVLDPGVPPELPRNHEVKVVDEARPLVVSDKPARTGDGASVSAVVASRSGSR